MLSSRMPIWASVLFVLFAAAHTTEAKSTPEAVRASRDQQQLALVRERLARRVRSAFLKDVDGGATEEEDDGAVGEDEQAEGDDDDTEKLRKEVARLKKELSTKKKEKAHAPQPPAPEAATEPFVEAAAEPAKTTPARLPYSGQVAALTPFGREDVGRELTERSIMESDRMVDQIEKAEVAEEKRAVYRALTRLRGAAINSFDGVAHSQVGNIDEYATTHNFLNEHPLKHLAKEESNVAAWAFPNDEPKEPLMGLLEVPDS